MATVLFVGGVSPSVTQDELSQAFYPHVNMLASSIVRCPREGHCLGQAYITVVSEDVPKAVAVTQVGVNNVCVLPVEVEAWIAPAPPAPHALGAFGPTANESSGGMQAGLATMGADNVHLHLVQEQLQEYLDAHPRLGRNGKPYFTLLNEVCQKRQLTIKADPDGMDKGAFVCTISLYDVESLMWTVRGLGGNKKDAKHNAAAACLDKLLAMGLIPTTELVTAMTCEAQNTAVSTSVGMQPGMSHTAASSPVAVAATAAVIQTQNIMRLRIYPRCAELMQAVHASESGRMKTVLMMLNEFAARQRYDVRHEDISAPGGLGCFRFQSQLFDIVTRTPVAQAAGAELRSKQEAKQASAAALLEVLMTQNGVTMEALIRGPR